MSSSPEPPPSAEVALCAIATSTKLASQRSQPRPVDTAPEAWTDFSVDFVPSDAAATISLIAERDRDDSSFDVDNVCLFLLLP